MAVTATIDETASSFEELVESIIESAQVETTMKRLLDEFESTKRRVNALEFKVIPDCPPHPCSWAQPSAEARLH